MRQLFLAHRARVIRIGLIIVTLSGWSAVSTRATGSRTAMPSLRPARADPRSAGGERRRAQPPLTWASVGAQRFRRRRARGARHTRIGDRARPGVRR